VEGGGKASGGTEAIVGAIEIGEAVGDEDGGKNIPPAAIQDSKCLRLRGTCWLRRGPRRG